MKTDVFLNNILANISVGEVIKTDDLKQFMYQIKTALDNCYSIGYYDGIQFMNKRAYSGRKIGVVSINIAGEEDGQFNSISECANFYQADEKTIRRKIESNQLFRGHLFKRV